VDPKKEALLSSVLSQALTPTLSKGRGSLYLLVAAFVAHDVGAYLKRNPGGPENLKFLSEDNFDLVGRGKLE